MCERILLEHMNIMMKVNFGMIKMLAVMRVRFKLRMGVSGVIFHFDAH